ncbi:MAG: glycosyltransferase family 2 protein [Akkermansia sp.]|nr:glycosyltransferase family 2 protein [Akkermansia sp.]
MNKLQKKGGGYHSPNIESCGHSECPLVSIIIPAYNVAPYIGQCMDSVVNQTYKNLQIICVDDGSEDDTPNILKEYAEADPRIKLIVQENTGHPIVRNKGLDLAQGEWVMLIDSDDWLETDAVERCVALAQQYQTTLLHFGYRKVSENGESLSEHLPVSFRISAGLYQLTPELQWGFARHNYLWTKFIRRELIERLQLRFPPTWFEDIVFLQTLYAELLGEHIYITDEVLYNYRQRSNSVMWQLRAKSSKAMDGFPALDYLLQNFRKLKLEHKLSLFSAWICFRVIHERVYNNVPTELLPDAYEKANRFVREYGLYKGFLNKLRLWSCLKPRAKWTKLFISSGTYKVTLRFFGIPFFRMEWNHGGSKISILGITIKRRKAIKISD